jgi:(2Fe-2S) ferredoxin
VFVRLQVVPLRVKPAAHWYTGVAAEDVVVVVTQFVPERVAPAWHVYPEIVALAESVLTHWSLETDHPDGHVKLDTLAAWVFVRLQVVPLSVKPGSHWYTGVAAEDVVVVVTQLVPESTAPPGQEYEEMVAGVEIPPIVTHSEPSRCVPAGQAYSAVGAAVFVLLTEHWPFCGAAPPGQLSIAFAPTVIVFEQLLPDST